MSEWGSQKARASFILATAILITAGLISLRSNQQLVQSFDWVSESRRSLQTLQYIQTMQEYAEAGVRAYVITGDKRRLEPLQTSKSIAEFKLSELSRHFQIFPEDSGRFETLRTLLSNHLDYLERIARQRQTQGFEAAAHTILVEDEASHRFQLERVLAKLEDSERGRLDHRRNQTLAISFRSKLVLAMGTLISLALLFFAYLALHREFGVRLKVERSLEQMQAFLQSVIDNIPYAIVVKEAQNLRWTLVNKATENWMQMPREQLAGSNSIDLYPSAAAELNAADREALSRNSITDVSEEEFMAPGQLARVVHTQKIPIYGPYGDARFLMCISEDITERRKAEKMLRMAHDAALETARMKTEFISNMSHEIRTPIAIMTGMTSLLLDTELSSDQSKFARAVHRAGENLSAIAKTLLNFSKIESGKFFLETLPFDPREIVEDVVGMHTEQAATKKISLAFVLSPEVPMTLEGDSARLRQILTQVVGNSVKFSNHGEIVVRVSKTKEVDGQVWLYFCVSDNGIGIQKELQTLVFDAFRQGDGSATRKFGGTGMGLTIAKRTVELMGGEIGLKSEEGKGSNFWWTLPFSKVGRSGPLVNVPRLPWNRSRILVVDDNPIHRELVVHHLSALALASEAVSTGQAAIDLIRRESRAGRTFEVCLLDLHLPDMDATAVAKTLHAEPGLADLKIIAMTDSEPPDAETLKILGISECLRKPLQAETLHEGLALATKPRRQQAA